MKKDYLDFLQQHTMIQCTMIILVCYVYMLIHDNSIPQAGFQYAVFYRAVISCCIMVWFYISGILLTQVVCLPSKNTSQGKLIESLAKVLQDLI